MANLIEPAEFYRTIDGLSGIITSFDEVDKSMFEYYHLLNRFPIRFIIPIPAANPSPMPAPVAKESPQQGKPKPKHPGEKLV